MDNADGVAVSLDVKAGLLDFPEGSSAEGAPHMSEKQEKHGGRMRVFADADSVGISLG